MDNFNNFISNVDYNYEVCLGVYIEEAKDLSYKYSIMYNTTGNPDRTDIPNTLGAETLFYLKENIKNTMAKWITSGFLTL